MAEHIVYFDDDFFLTSPVNKSDFFCKGLPKYCSLTSPKYTSDNMSEHEYTLMNNTGLFNSHYDFRKIILNNPEKWLIPFNSPTAEYNMRT